MLELEDAPSASTRPSPPGNEVDWGDAVPWVLHQRTGDLGLPPRQWPSMVAWVDAFGARAGADVDVPEGGFSFGDWLDASAPPDNPAAVRTPWQAVAIAYLARSARTLAQVAGLLGEDGTWFAQLGERAASRFRDEFVSPTGRVAFPSQTAWALALEFDLLAPEQRPHTGRLLARQVLDDGFHIATASSTPRGSATCSRTPASWPAPTSFSCWRNARAGCTRC